MRAAREDEGVTLPELAERSGVSLGFLSRVENGGSVPRREKFERLVEVLAHDERQARHLRRNRDRQELADRFGVEEGIAHLVVVLADEHREPGELRRAVERLTPEQQTVLHRELIPGQSADAPTVAPQT